MIAEVVFNLPLERSFHYLVPADLASSLQPGMRIAVPFGARRLIGFVTQRLSSSPIKQLKPVERAIDPSPVIADERWELARWMAAHYCCSLGEALAAMVPSQLRLGSPAALPAAAQHDRRSPSHQGWGGVPGAAGDRPTLSAHQRAAFEVIAAALDHASPRTFLIHGVTGSGKTELYLHAIERTLAAGKSAICLIPEIALTPQMFDRFRARFGDHVAVWHSRMTARQRASEWRRLASGASRIVVGARSAVFAPVARLGLIILDEEHERTYKQEDTPRYHARDVAIARAKLAGAIVLLGSATPSVESYYAARASRSLIELPERIHGRPLPAVELVDLRGEAAGRRRGGGPLSLPLQRALEQVVERGEQAMLLLNRRGFARVAQCQTCGTVVQCRRCSVPLIYHASRQALICHYCNDSLPPPEMCAQCRKGYVKFRGAGTERVESELHRLFPSASIARMDHDTTTSRDSHRKLYEALRDQHIALLTGTQMIAKGFDFPQVTLIGVVSADTELNLPDFRAGERTFDLLTQAAGRAGRGAQPGRVIIQTYNPANYAIQAAQRHDYRSFYAQELRMRKRLTLPPFARLMELTLHGGSRSRVQEAATALGEALRGGAERPAMTVLGPAPHRIPRLRRTYRMCLMLSGKQMEPIVAHLRTVLQPGRKFRGLPVTVDVDPL